jgi:hypothetical protein
MIRLDLPAFGHLGHGDRRRGLEHFRKAAFVIRGHVEDDNPRDPRLRRHVGKEFLERLDATCRRTEPDNGTVRHGRTTGILVAG